MEEQPQGTPNPLNPNLNAMPLDANPSEPVRPVKPAEPTEPVKPAEPVKSVTPPARPMSARPGRPIGMMRPMSPAPKPAPRPIVPTTPTPVTPPVSDSIGTLGMVTNLDGTPSDRIDPLNRPMTKLAEPEPVKPDSEAKTKAKAKNARKRKGLFVGMMVSLFVAIACGMAALLIMLNTPKPDMVATAVNRLVSGNTPENVMVDGTIDLKAKNSNAEISSIKISLGTEAVIKTKINSTMAKLDFNMKNGSSFSVSIFEIYAANGDLYLKVDGLKSLMENTDFLSGLTADAESLKYADSSWIRMPMDNLSSILGSKEDSEALCVMDVVGDFNNSGNTLSGIYLNNPFIGSTDQDLTLTGERDPIYKVVIDDQKLQAFANGAHDTTAIKNLVGCLGRKSATNVTDEFVKIIQQLPEIYAEVNGEANLTRVFFNTEVGDWRVEADFWLSYPVNVNVPEPVEYLEFSEIIQSTTEGTEEAEEELTEEEAETGAEVDPEVKEELRQSLRDEAGETSPRLFAISVI